MTPKVWFITGISRGLGKALAAAVLKRGDLVVGTTRSGSADLPAHERLSVLRLDVTDRAAVFAQVAAAHALHGQLDVVVNNAGYGLLGPVESSSEHEVRDVMAANFFGTLYVAQATLSLMRPRGQGRVINVSSIAGLAPSAGSGLYAAAKFAVEGFSASLAQEVAPLGIRVTCVEPGAFRTDFLNADSIRHTAESPDAYAPTSGQVVKYLQEMAGRQLGDPARAAEAICTLADAPEPPLHLVLGSDALKRARAMLAQFERTLDEWEAVSVSTDLPDRPLAEEAK